MSSPQNSDSHKREVERQWRILSKGVVDLLPEAEFKEKLLRSISENRPLRVKQGFDPTSPDIHLGHTVGIRKLRQFQDLGHQVVLIIGDYTALVGDPSGQSATRPKLGYEEIMSNAETYQEQFFRILDKSKTEVRFNGEWFKPMSFLDVMDLAGRYTVARLLERDDFSKRLKSGTPISIHELFYPLMQAYDSVAIKADVEIGATEQKFNLLAGRTVQESFSVAPQCILTMPILVGTDGTRKMSKSLGNYIGIEESATEIFGKVMSIPDKLILDYFQLVTDVDEEKLARISAQLTDKSINPMALKKELGKKVVNMYHSNGSGEKACEEFERVFSQKKLPEDIQSVSKTRLRELGLGPETFYLVHLMTKCELTKSNGEARKLIAAGGVSIDGEKITDVDRNLEISNEMVLKVGKRRFLRLLP